MELQRRDAVNRNIEGLLHIRANLERMAPVQHERAELHHIVQARRIHRQGPQDVSVDRWPEDQFRYMTRFTKRDFEELHTALHFPPKLLINRHINMTTRLGLFLALNRMAFPCRLFSIGQPFNLDKSQCSIAINLVLKNIREKTEEVLFLDPRLLKPDLLQTYANSYTFRGSELHDIVGFIDGTHFDICRPGVLQQLFYSGHTASHCIKLHVVLLPNGMIASISRVFEGTAHDSRMVDESGFEDAFRFYLQDQPGLPEGGFFVYGDMGYTQRGLIKAPRKRDRFLPDHNERRKIYESLTGLRVEVEHEMKEIKSNSKMVTYKTDLKLLLQDVPTHLMVAVFLANVHTVCYGSQILAANDEVVEPAFRDIADYLSFIPAG